MRLVWCTDLHLNFVDIRHWELWVDQVKSTRPDALLIGGDISESEDLLVQLDRMDRALEIPIYFVLGNHDYYRSSIQRVRSTLRSAVSAYRNWRFLTGSAAISLTPQVALVGHDAWGDASLGDFENSKVHLHDFDRIDDLRWLSRPSLYERLRELGRDSVSTLQPSISHAVEGCSRMIILTHVPPFEEVCLYENRPSDPYWLPFFSCGALGCSIRQLAEANKTCHFEVLSGHTHHFAESILTDNLVARVGHAEYGRPGISGILDL